MLWLLRTLPLALAVGLAAGMGAAYLKASKRIAVLEYQLANAEPVYACAPTITWSELPAQPVKLMLALAPSPSAARSFAAPAPQPAAPVPQAMSPNPCRTAAASAGPPPLPFTYLGKMLDEGKLQVFLARGEDSHIVRAGQKIGQYRVERVDETSVTFLHLPSKTRQTLDIPAVSE